MKKLNFTCLYTWKERQVSRERERKAEIYYQLERVPSYFVNKINSYQKKLNMYKST